MSIKVLVSVAKVYEQLGFEDIGHASLILMVMVYSARKPGKYVGFYEKLLAGKILPSIHLKVFEDISVRLNEGKNQVKKRRMISNECVLRSLSSIMRDLAKFLSEFGG